MEFVNCIRVPIAVAPPLKFKGPEDILAVWEDGRWMPPKEERIQFFHIDIFEVKDERLREGILGSAAAH